MVPILDVNSEQCEEKKELKKKSTISTNVDLNKCLEQIKIPISKWAWNN